MEVRWSRAQVSEFFFADAADADADAATPTAQKGNVTAELYDVKKLKKEYGAAKKRDEEKKEEVETPWENILAVSEAGGTGLEGLTQMV